LAEARKSIENEMERFKVLEKETKTKAYSKEGLSQVLKKNRAANAKDPKAVTSEWIDKMKDMLQEQIDEYESKVENFKGVGKKKKHHNEDIEGLQKHIERHNWHLEQLEEVREKLNNDEVTVKRIKTIQEDVEYYISDNLDPDFVENEEIYEGLQNEDDDDDDDEPEEEEPKAATDNEEEEKEAHSPGGEDEKTEENEEPPKKEKKKKKN